MNSHYEWAVKELEFLKDGDEMNLAVRNHLLKMCVEFEKAGHSGFSANYAANILNKLLRYEPILPLTGNDDEWQEVGDGVFQNIRCHRVFKENGQAYDIEGKVFKEPSGVCFTNKNSRVEITFPYTPTTEYLGVWEVNK